MSKISRALEKAKKERDESRLPEQPRPVAGIPSGNDERKLRDESVVIDAVKGLQPLVSNDNEPTLFDSAHAEVESRPRIHDPEIHRIKVRRRSPYHPQRRSPVRTIIIMIVSLLVLFGVLTYIYVQVNQDPFEKLGTANSGTQNPPVLRTTPLGEGGQVRSGQLLRQQERRTSSALKGETNSIANSPLARGEATKSQGGFENSGQGTQNPSSLAVTLPLQGEMNVKSTEVTRPVVVEKAEPPLKITALINNEEAKRDVVRAPVIKGPFIKKVASFDSGQRLNEIGGAFHTFADDQNYMCNDFFNSLHARLGTGFALKLVYNVDALKPVRNGLVMDLVNIPIEEYKTLSFYMKGDQEKGFTSTVIAGIETSRRTRMYTLNNVTYRWEKVVIPLSEFKEEGETLKEFRFIFQSDYVTNSNGAVFIDDVTLEK